MPEDPTRASLDHLHASRWRAQLERLDLPENATVDDALRRRDKHHAPVHVALRVLIDEAERVILAEQQATGRTLTNLSWAVDAARQVLAEHPARVPATGR